MDQHQEQFKVSVMCRVLEVSRSGYYEWRTRLPSLREQADEVLSQKIEAHFEQNRRVYGTRRLKHCLAEEEGEQVSRRRIGRLMAENELEVKTKRKFKVTTDSRHDQPVAPNKLERQFEVEQSDRVYVGDITYIWTREGWLYLAVIIDLFSRAVVGWSMSTRLQAELVNRALMMAITQRQPAPGLLMHTDRGSQYVADSYQKILHDYAIEPSMSRKANCWDNAVAESFFHTLKTELIYLEDFETRDQACDAVFEYIEVFYNRQRRHSANQYLAPLVYEQTLKVT
jgi:transposase InsO family protein